MAVSVLGNILLVRSVTSFMNFRISFGSSGIDSLIFSKASCKCLISVRYISGFLLIIEYLVNLVSAIYYPVKDEKNRTKKKGVMKTYLLFGTGEKIKDKSKKLRSEAMKSRSAG
jgi:hypothetical protein